MPTDEVGQQPRRHRPAVEIEARPARGDGMEGWVDIVRTTLEGLHGEAAPRQRAHQAQSDSRLARAGAHGGDDETARAHRQPTRPASSCCLSPTMAPITTMAGGPIPCDR